jgi:hypothetical protein
VAVGVGVASSIFFSVGLVAFSLGLPSKEIWESGKPLVVVLIVTGIVTAIYQPIVNLNQRQRKQQGILNDACREVAAHMDDECPELPLRRIGVHIWRVKGLWRWKRLVRAGRFLIRGRASSNVIWQPKKGVLGLAWKERAPVIVDLKVALYSKVDSEAAAKQMSPEERLGLSWDEIQRTNAYKAIYATPLFNGSSRKIRGFLAIDVLEDERFTDLEHATHDNDNFSSILGLCETAIQA